MDADGSGAIDADELFAAFQVISLSRWTMWVSVDWVLT